MRTMEAFEQVVLKTFEEDLYSAWKYKPHFEEWKLTRIIEIMKSQLRFKNTLFDRLIDATGLPQAGQPQLFQQNEEKKHEKISRVPSKSIEGCRDGEENKEQSDEEDDDLHHFQILRHQKQLQVEQEQAKTEEQPQEQKSQEDSESDEEYQREQIQQIKLAKEVKKRMDLHLCGSLKVYPQDFKPKMKKIKIAAQNVFVKCGIQQFFLPKLEIVLRHSDKMKILQEMLNDKK